MNLAIGSGPVTEAAAGLQSLPVMAIDMHGTDNHNSCCDYLITPPLDLTESEDYRLDFDSYYTGAYGQLAFVEYSYDRGETWEVMWQLNPGNNWNKLSTSRRNFYQIKNRLPTADC